MSVGLRKIEGVESVTVSLNRGLASAQLKPGNSVRLEQVREFVERNGFTPKDATVTARGEVTSTSGKLQLKVLEANQTYDIQIQPQAGMTSEEIRKHVGQTVLIDGLIPAPTKGKVTPLIHVKSIRESER